MCTKEQNIILEWPSWIWPRPICWVSSFQQWPADWRVENDQDKHIVILALNTVLLTRGVKNPLLVLRQKILPLWRWIKTKKKLRGIFRKLSCWSSVSEFCWEAWSIFLSEENWERMRNINYKTQHYDSIFFPLYLGLFFTWHHKRRSIVPKLEELYFKSQFIDNCW